MVSFLRSVVMVISSSGLARAAINANGPLRAAVKSKPVQHVIQTGRAARLVSPAPVFALGQFTRRSRRYELGDGTRVLLRHRTRDVPILVEIFGRGTYQPPARVDLAGPIRVLDLGGNIGLFGAYALQRWNVRELVSYEPDPANYALLEVTARAARWKTEHVAVSERAGTMRFLTGQCSESREAQAGEPGGIDVPMVDVFQDGPCDLLKMDIEGGEWPILADPRLAGFARVIVVEWHAVGSPDPTDAFNDARRLLSDAGYVNQADMPREHDGNGVLWAWA